MLTCIACSKQHLNAASLPQPQHDDDDDAAAAAISTPSTRQAIKALTSQIKDIGIKASGTYKNCKPCSGSSNHHNNHGDDYADSEPGSVSGRYHFSYARAAAGSSNSMPRRPWGKEMESRLKVLSSSETTPASVSGWTESVVFMEEDEPKEWVAQVEPGILITN
ncbi:protein Brevis radix-like 3 [Coffea eugenioides]|uniref:protein Brevis radix-like 3 n=1 Tax=Coffea eugenioides TaxID=49369 RepID=UPI000F60472A|nr:protein Brevis radix-like 3 [Coffea eugenioides]